MTIHIRIQGLVQGVGFRPLIYCLAKARQLKGYVSNGNDGINIYINASIAYASAFVEEIKRNAPAQAIIEKCSISLVEHAAYPSFDIRESRVTGSPDIPLTPDYAICDECRKEMNEKNSRRYQYPFITCTTCGPRYSIIQSLPFDRKNTSMKSFALCEQCATEYNWPSDRRYYAQTNSCGICGIRSMLYDNGGAILAEGNQAAVSMAVALLQQGKIIAVKGIGGYLLMTDATDHQAVQLLRKRKQRPHKPFAVLFSSVEEAGQYVQVNEEAESLLRSSTSPVVIVPARNFPSKKLASDDIAPGLHSLGVMIPYAPLLQLISDKFGKPLIATSANFSGSPVIYNDEEALNGLCSVADALLLHNRSILVPQDDSVVSAAASSGKIILRRSRGMAPSYFQYKAYTSNTVLATGALMKSSFAISNRHAIYISQYLGSTNNYEAQLAYRHTLNHLLNVLKTSPEKILADKHPEYFSHQIALELGEVYNVSVSFIQHHKAHFAAVLAENRLLNSDNILGVVWDGTGLGDDGCIWGSEFFVYAGQTIRRCSHLAYFKNLLNDQTARDPRLAALCIAENNSAVLNLLKEKFSEQEWKIYNGMLKQKQYILSASMGRLFDAVACLLTLCDKQSYEGQAAMLLENKAVEFTARHGFDFNDAYSLVDEGGMPSPVMLLAAVAADRLGGKDVSYIAAVFHYSLVCLIDELAKKEDLNKIAFSGGVFQNSLLCAMITHYLGNRYQLYFHQQLSPNDENISFGQLVYYDNKIDEYEMISKEMESYRISEQK